VNEVLAVAASARAAARAWRRAGIHARLEVMRQIGRALVERQHELVHTIQHDGPSQVIAEYYAAWLRNAVDPSVLDHCARALCRVLDTGAGKELLVRRADGLVVLQLPRNSATIQMGAIFSMLLAGNAVVVRVPVGNVGAHFVIDEIIRPSLVAAGFSAMLVSPLTAQGPATLIALTGSPLVDTIVFFGNYGVGMQVAAEAHRQGKKIVLELEGSDHLVVWKDADLDAAVRSASRAWMGSTQPCTVPKHVLVHPDVAEPFLARFVAEVPRHATTVIDDPVGGMLVPLAHPERYPAALAEILEIGELCCGGTMLALDGSPTASGPFAAPTVVRVPASALAGTRLRCFDEEISYPLIPVVCFAGSDEQVASDMLELLDASPFGLRTSIWAADAQVLARFVAELDAVGLIVCNDDHTRSPRLASPWGGPRRSGGPRGESHYFWEQTTHLQAIACTQLAEHQLDALLDALGYVR
jgi:acyl-CoA reductase-like NAD-dependent aldehyde dehydrogenase